VKTNKETPITVAESWFFEKNLREFGEIEELPTRYRLIKEIIAKKIGETAKQIGRKNRTIKNVHTMSKIDVAVR
jgi:hypothetical protein